MKQDFFRLNTNPKPEVPPQGSADMYYDATANTVKVRLADGSTVNFGGGGVSTFAELTDKASATIATTNESVANALAGKLSLAEGGTITGTLVVDYTIEFTDNVVVAMTSGALASWLDELGLTDWSGLSPSSYVAKAAFPVTFEMALGDETTALTTGLKLTHRMPYAMTLSSVRISVTTAPTGSTLILNVKKNGTTIFSTKVSIDAGEKTSTTAASAAVLSTTALADDDEMTYEIDQIGSSVAGAGLKAYLIGTRNAP